MPAAIGDGRLPLPSAVDESRCFHCGQRCDQPGFISAGRPFCCLGCQTVFELLDKNGMGRFYAMASAPGVRTERTAGRRDWAFLDDLAVQEKLLDFSDERRAKVTLRLPGIHCVACVWLLEHLFRLCPGVGESRVDFIRREVSIGYDRTRVRLSDIAALLASLGYEPELTLDALDPGAKPGAPRRAQRSWLQIGLAGFGFGNVMLLSLPGYLGLDSSSGPWFRVLAGWLSLVLALPVLVYSAGDYWRAAWSSLKRRGLTLDVPIAVGLAAIYAQSVFEVATRRGEGYCDSLTGLVFFLLCGRMFQRKTFDRLTFDRDYKGFFPLAVTRLAGCQSPVRPVGLADGAGSDFAAGLEASVAISQLAVGDRLLIRNGELVPADSKLLSGEARLDYSFVTGESEPVATEVGGMLRAGGRQTGGAIEVQTVKPVSESYLTSLWNSEAFCKGRNDGIDSQTDRYSRRFTWIVLGVAVASGAFWLVADASVAGKALVSVLIVACPCALALAAPLTLGTAQRRLAARHLFLRNDQVVEWMAEVDTIVFDKTGTLTSPGAGSVAWMGTPLSVEETDWVRSMARHSAHPLAKRLGEALRLGEIHAVDSFVETPGAGLEGEVQDHQIWIGSAAWLQSRGVRRPVAAPSWKENIPAAWNGEGASVGKGGDGAERRDRGTDGSAVHVAVDGSYRGCFVLENAPRPEMDGLMKTLLGRYRLVLLSGDHAGEAARFRELLGEEARMEFHQSPFDKLRVIRELQASGRIVMMVGDGLNDAGALKQSDVGVAVVENVGAFSPASDAILEGAWLPRLAEMMLFSRRAARVVRAGFAVSGLYNVVGVSIAAAGMLSPLVCAVLMPLSSISVVLFAVGATSWIARRSFKESSVDGQEVRTPHATDESLWTPASTGGVR